MKNRNRIVICGTVFMSVILCPSLPACVIDSPPVAVSQPDPAYWALDAAGFVDAEICGGNSYDPDWGTPYCCDRGVASHEWYCGSGTITGYYEEPYRPTHLCAYVRFPSLGKHNVYQWVTDFGGLTSDSTTSDVWVFDISASLSQSVIGVGETATLTMSHGPSNLPGCENLTLNTLAEGVVEVLNNGQPVISGADNSHTWGLPGPSAVTVKGCMASPILAVLWLKFTPDGQNFPCSDYNGNSVTVKVVGVQKVVKAGTSDEGPLYVVCPDDTIQLQAIPWPSEGPWPSGEPHWEFVSQPGAATITPSSGSGVVAVTGFNAPGEYVIKAKCGRDDVGDQITIIIPPPSSGPWLSFIWDFNCPPGPGPEILTDDCGNQTSVTCELTAYHFYYKPNGGTRTEVGICVWDGGINRFRYRATDPYVYGKMRFLETRHVTQNDATGIDSDGEGCRNNWCWRVQRYDCVHQSAVSGSPWWRRDPYSPGDDELGGEADPGPGTQEGLHPHYPN